MAKLTFAIFVLLSVVGSLFAQTSLVQKEAAPGTHQNVGVQPILDKTQITIESHPSSEFYGYFFHLGVTLHKAIPLGTTLTLIASGSDNTTVSRTYNPGVAADSFFFIPSSGANGLYTITFAITGTAEGLFNLPPPIEFTAVHHAQVILTDGAPDYVFAGEYRDNIPFHTGIPVPPGNNFTLIITDDIGFRTEAIVTPGKVVGHWSYQADRRVGARVITFTVSDSLAPYYIPPPPVVMLVIDAMPVTLIGFPTMVPYAKPLADAKILLGAPVPEGGDLTVYIEASSGDSFQVAFETDEFEMDIPLAFTEKQDGCYTLSFFLEGSAHTHYKPLPPFSFCVVAPVKAEQIYALAEPATSVWIDQPYAFSLTLTQPVPADKELIIEVTGTDGQTKSLKVLPDSALVVPVEWVPAKAGDLEFSFTVSGSAAENYLAAPSFAVQVIAKDSLHVIPLGFPTEFIVEDCENVRAYLGVPLPKDVQLSLTISSEHNAPVKVNFGGQNDGDLIQNFTYCTGALDEVRTISIASSNESYFKSFPNFGVVVWDNNINEDVFQSRLAAEAAEAKGVF